MIDRRKFLGIMGLGLSAELYAPKLASALTVLPRPTGTDPISVTGKAYGSGYFGEWMTDAFGLPAFKYTCDQVNDSKAISPVHKEWRAATDQIHEVGNDRLVAVASNYGYVQVRQDEGSPKFLNDYCPEESRYGGGIGFLTDGESVLSTYYPGNAETFDRIFGEGYLKKSVKGHHYAIEQTIIAPYGDDPVLVSMVKVTNHQSKAADLRWVEYWGAQQWQISYRTGMEADVLGDPVIAARLRREFAARFDHKTDLLANKSGLIEKKTFRGRTQEDETIWHQLEGDMKNPKGPWGGHIVTPAPDSAMDDVNPPRTFLVSLDAPMDGYATDAVKFFGSGGIARPSGLEKKLLNELGAKGAESALLVERNLHLEPNESRTLYFLYGYLPEGFNVEALITKYSADPEGILNRSATAWKHEGLHFSVPSEPWVAREISWHNYYLRGEMTYDSFFREHIISQGSVYQYIMGFQGAARDPLQYAMPFIFSDPSVVRELIRFILKEIQPDGSIPYAFVGSGVPMPSAMDPADQEMWLLWTTAEYVLGTRDKNFLNETITRYPHREASASDPTVRQLLAHAYSHLVNVIGVGKHGLMRIAKGDWNDGVVIGRVDEKYMDEVREQGESVLNAAMACYVLDHYARLLNYIGDAADAADARAKAEAQREAVRATWTGSWFRRAWLGPNLDWTGTDTLWLEPQPWAIIGGATTAEQRKALVVSLDNLVRRPSPIGAMMMSKGEDLPSKRPGILENGGVWPSINGTLIWALAVAGGGSAWDEWKKNSLAAHAEAYPEIWYGTWSGPDTYNSVLSKYPGCTQFAEPSTDGKKSPTDWGVNWTDFPVMNMHPHAWPLYSAVKLIGVEFEEHGVRFAPALPVAEYEFSSPLLGFKKSLSGYSGWYKPAVGGRWTIEIAVPEGDLAHVHGVRVNDAIKQLTPTDGVIRFEGESTDHSALTWELV